MDVDTGFSGVSLPALRLLIALENVQSLVHIVTQPDLCLGTSRTLEL